MQITKSKWKQFLHFPGSSFYSNLNISGYPLARDPGENKLEKKSNAEIS